MAKELTLKSGAKLQITLSEFEVSLALHDAVLEEVKAVDVKAESMSMAVLKDLFCTLMSSKKVKAALNECMKRAVYSGKRIDSETFQSKAARQDYYEVCFEVAKENLEDFWQSLYAQYSPLLEKLKGALA